MQEEAIKKMRIENPDVEELVKYHGYSEPLTVQQCNDIEEENSLLMRKIEEFESKKEIGL